MSSTLASCEQVCIFPSKWSTALSNVNGFQTIVNHSIRADPSCPGLHGLTYVYLFASYLPNCLVANLPFALSGASQQKWNNKIKLEISLIFLTSQNSFLILLFHQDLGRLRQLKSDISNMSRSTFFHDYSIRTPAIRLFASLNDQQHFIKLYEH